MTLVEVVAVMGLGALLSGIAVTTLASLIHADRGFHARSEQRPQLAALAAALRRDIAAAERVSWDAGRQTMELSAPSGESVIYRQLAQRWERLTRGADDVAEASPALTSAFRLPARTTCAVEPPEVDAGSVLTVTLARPRRDVVASSEGTVVEISAIVGRDLRLLHE